MTVEARVSDIGPTRAKASVRIEMPEGGISINGILVRRSGEKLQIVFPLSKENQPNVYLRGELKQAVNTAIAEAFSTERAAIQEIGASHHFPGPE